MMIACGNLNEDNREDVVVSGARVDIYFSYEDSHELYSIDEGEYRIEIADFDLDGDNDILGLSDLYMIGLAQFTFYENLGNNSFLKHEPFNFQPPGSKFIVSDINNDTLPDVVFLSHYSKNANKDDKGGSIYIFYNLGNFQLGDSMRIPVEASPYEGDRDVFCSDLDDNGYNDIILTRQVNVPTPNLKILFNDGVGNFVENPQTNVSDPNSNNYLKQKPILGCYPNPFSTETTFEYKIEETASVVLSVYNLQGSLIIHLINNFKKGGQINIVKWDGLDKSGKACKPGIYIVSLSIKGKLAKSIKLIKQT